MRFRYYFVVQDAQGNVVSNASVSVYLAGTTTPAIVYATRTSSQGNNTAPQLYSRENGSVVFWLDSNDYSYGQLFDIVVQKDSFSFSLSDVQIIVWDAVNASSADKVDGFHASVTPAPNVIPVSNSSGILEAGWLEGYFAKLYYQTGPSSQLTTSNDTTYNICSITVPPQPVVPPRGYWYVLAYLREDLFGGNNTAGGSQSWWFRVVRQSDNYVFNIGYLYEYKPAANYGFVGARGMCYLGNLNVNQSETYVFQLRQGLGAYDITVYQNRFTFYIILI